MKKLLALSVLSVLWLTAVKAQTEVIFKIKVLPNHTYTSVIKTNMDMKMISDAQKKPVTKKTKIKPVISPPMLMKMESNMQSEIKTGEVSANNDFQVCTTIQTLSLKMLMNGKETTPSMPKTEKKIYGKYTAEGKMEIDSMPGMKLNDTLKATLLRSINKMAATVEFPTNALKIGDTFNQDIPLDLPIMGFSAKMLSKKNYKLVAIENNKAYFDATYVITMDMLGKKGTMDMTGGGTEKIVYDMTNNYALSMQNNMNLVFMLSVPQGQTKMNGSMTMLTDQQTTIAAN